MVTIVDKIKKPTFLSKRLEKLEKTYTLINMPFIIVF